MTATSFGPGSMWGTQLYDAYGNAISNPTPVKFGILQDVAVNIDKDIKQLWGQGQVGQVAAAGKMKIDIKGKFAQINGSIFNSLFFGQTLASGQTINYVDYTGAVVPATPYTITPTVPASGTWTNDLGVRDSTGLIYTRVASAPASGQYSVASGVYTFAAANTGVTVFIDYQYSVAASGKTIAYNNMPMGGAPTFMLDIGLTNQGKSQSLRFYNCISSKLSMATKLDDFTIPELDVIALANTAGQVFALTTAE